MHDFTFTIIAKPNTGDYYEGSTNWMRAIYPRPVMSPARINGWHRRESVLFREDSYEPTSRTRRGRFYHLRDPFDLAGHTLAWHPYPQPYFIGTQKLVTFQTAYEQKAELNNHIRAAKGYAVTIGSSPAETRWRMIDAEGLSDGTTLFTLKALSSLGLLPDITAIDPEVVAAVERVKDTALRHDPASTVDACRESCRTVLLNYLLAKGVLAKTILGEDLHKIIEKIPLQEKMIINAAFLINRFHSRTKSAVRERADQKQPLRIPIDEDALLAVRLFGFLLVEMNFAQY